MIQAYYQDAAVTLFHGDGLEVARSLEDCSIDAVITDPPYCSGAVSEAARSAAGGQGLRSENLSKFGWFVGDNMTTAGLVWLLRSLAWEGTRILKPSGSMLCFMDWRMSPSLIPALESSGLRFQNLIVWDKGSMGLGTGFRACHELIAHFTNGEPAFHDKSRGNVLRHPRVGGDRLHQTEKPEALIGDILAVTVPVGGVVLDPFGGSGTTAAAACRLGRRAILAERDKGHCETIATRLAGRQTQLFSAP